MGTSGWAFMIACLRVRCGSSVYVQKKSWSLTSRSSEGGASLLVMSSSGSCFNPATVLLRGARVVTVDMEDGILRRDMPASQ